MRPRAALLLSFALLSGCTQAQAPASEAPPAAPPAAAPAAGPVAPPTTDADMITSALSAAPAALASAAAVMAMDDKGAMRTLREGTNGWTCMPDLPHTPGADPMCLDAYGMEWAHAWMNKQDPPAGKMGFGYMLAGGSDASNTDPFATAPKEGDSWVDTGPHVMIFNIGTAFSGYPTTAENTAVPYVMFAGTPYAHLMLPVR